ncbi:hypothetical protein CgunFtcFv8_021859 [Champsocephalus gunnari]|uniref:Uncharacterized protein n=1 Tax=Champsocephalus gunnari TaxID=52237 RepID=A0AAN8HWW7_CHAGU|nr:hypothetical protein CgunFtcFv8_021859 [Champsocephalus gunnari]
MEKFSKMGVKQESSDGEEEGACGWSKDMSGVVMSAREARERLRESAVKMARDAGMSPSSAAFRRHFQAGCKQQWWRRSTSSSRRVRENTQILG